MKEKYIDLHIHTNMSDGLLSPTEVVDYSKERGLSAIAITDHNSISGISEANERCRQYGIELINGIEIDAVFNGLTVHILGFFIDVNSKYLNDFLEQNNKNITIQYVKWIRFLKRIGINIEVKELKKRTSGFETESLINYLIKEGVVSSIEQAYELYSELKEMNNQIKPHVEEAISIIKDSKGISFLAHPIRSFGNETERIVNQLMPFELNGLECYQSDHSKRDIDYLKRLSYENNLLISGGSDYHQKSHSKTEKAPVTVSYDILEKLKKVS